MEQLQRATSAQSDATQAQLDEHQRLQSQLLEAEQKAKSLTKEVEASQAEVRDLQARAESSTQDLAGARQQLQAVEATAAQRLRALQGQLSDCEGQLVSAKKNMLRPKASGDSTTGVLEGKLEQAAQEVKAEREKALAAGGRARELLEQVQQLEAGAGKVQERSQSAEAATIELEEELRKSRAEGEAIKAENAELLSRSEAAAQNAAAAVGQKDGEIEGLKSALEALKAEASSSSVWSAETERLQQLKESAEAKSVELRVMLESAESQLAERRESLESSQIAVEVYLPLPQPALSPVLPSRSVASALFFVLMQRATCVVSCSKPGKMPRRQSSEQPICSWRSSFCKNR